MPKGDASVAFTRNYIGVDPGADEPSVSHDSLYNHGGSQADWKIKTRASLPLTPNTRAGLLGMLPEETANKFWHPKFAPDGTHVTLYFAASEKPADGWGDLRIGTVFAGGENGELLEVVEHYDCHGCHYAHSSCAANPYCDRFARHDGKSVRFVNLERTSDA